MDLNVVVKLRIMPKDVSTSLKEIESFLKEIVSGYGKLHSTEIKPIAFGLKALEATILLDDKKGGIEEIEEKLKSSEEISQVDVIEVSRI
ncbi:MAG TPA: elongation factor 1-beta [Candidatus Altiarchaeales archaeon]|nr:elongation factor 1-beta [Candidatus Altiarchaeales archaeon]